MTTMPENLTPLEQFALVLLRTSAFEEYGQLRSWKGYDWDIMNRLCEMGFISNPVGKAKSVVFTEAGRRQADALVTTLLGAPASSDPAKEPSCECGCREAKPGGGFLPGHDQRLRVSLESRVGGLRSLQALVNALESYTKGEVTTEEMTREVRAALGHTSSRPTKE